MTPEQAIADGWAVLPVQPGKKGPPWSWSSVWDATRDLSRWQPWVWDIANLAGRTGDRYVALDIDPREGSEATLRELSELPSTRTHSTPSGGWHLVYLAPQGTLGGKLGEGVTVRGLGSYVLLPGSAIFGLGEYQVLDTRPPVQAPEWVLERLPIHTPPGLTTGGVDGVAVDLAELPGHLVELLDEPPGDRSKQTWHLVAASVEAGLDDGQILALVRQFGPARTKYAGRLDGEVLRLLAKLRPKHPHPGQACDVAGCEHAPSWMQLGGAT